MKAEVISIGTELLLGDITDTNATTIALALRQIGLDLIYRTTVGDNEERIARVIDSALDRVQVVITTGGLGPTVDDVTREAIARATGRRLEFHQILLDQIAERFKRFGVKMTENNRRQAFAPQGAILIENPVGTAPVFILKTERGVILTLPGVPKEMQHLLQNALVPWLTDYLGSQATIKSLILRTAGIGESQIDARIAELMTASNPTVGLAAHSGQTDIRITAKAANEAEADQLIAPVEHEIQARVGDWIFGTGTQALEDVVMGLVAERGYSLATIEYGTQGNLKSRLNNTRILPESRRVSSQVSDWLADRGSSVRDGAAAEAQRIRIDQRADLGLAIVVSESVDDGTKLTRVGIAIATDKEVHVRDYSWGAERTDGHVWVTTHALAQLRRYLIQEPNLRPA